MRTNQWVFAVGVLVSASVMTGCLGRKSDKVQEEQRQDPVTLQGHWVGQASFKQGAAAPASCSFVFKTNFVVNSGVTIEEIGVRCPNGFGSTDFVTRPLEYRYFPSTSSCAPGLVACAPSPLFEGSSTTPVGKLSPDKTGIVIRTFEPGREFDLEAAIQANGEMKITRFSYVDPSSNYQIEINEPALLKRVAKGIDARKWESLTPPADVATSSLDARILECQTLGPNSLTTRIVFGETKFDNEKEIPIRETIDVTGQGMAPYRTVPTALKISGGNGIARIDLQVEEPTYNYKHDLRITTRNFVTARLDMSGPVSGKRDPKSICYFRKRN